MKNDVDVYGYTCDIWEGAKATIHHGGRAIILGGSQMHGQGEVYDGGQIWIGNRGMVRIRSGGEGFAVVGSCVTIEPGGIVHMYSEQEWPEVAERTWKDAGGRAAFPVGDVDEMLGGDGQ